MGSGARQRPWNRGLTQTAPCPAGLEVLGDDFYGYGGLEGPAVPAVPVGAAWSMLTCEVRGTGV
jgi:hypothetical protein